MSPKRALVVDDSRSARAFLTRMLERHDLTVDAAASAEEALSYLSDRRPDVIFMDHLMPGMDGFQALSAIKNNPRTATIPVMMYTSQEGELYLSQARALGAIGVLPKQIQPTDVTRALEQLKLVGVDVSPLSTAERKVLRVPEPPPAVEAGDLRQYIQQQMESHTGRVVNELRQLMNEHHAPAEELRDPAPLARKPARNSKLTLAAMIVGGFLLVTVFYFWLRASSELADLQQQLTVSQADLAAAKLELAQRARGPGVAGATAATDANSLSLPVPFGELPLSGSRVERLQALLGRLVSQGFKGVVQIHAVAGRYCLVSGANDAVALAPDEMPVAKCDQLGNPLGDPSVASQRESVAFANLLAAQRKSLGEAIDIQVTGGGVDENAHAYPDQTEGVTAAEWNRVAAANNRVDVRWRAASAKTAQAGSDR
ncbi:MAG TPA: response regulator [Steroidobacteraceae bacterium]|nr:response regulator [Steroidobacteraceae bacterium]